MKIYAKQVPPEYQESPLFLGDEFWPENVLIFGNRDFVDHAERLKDIRQALEDIYDVCNGWSYTRKLCDVIPARDDGREYTRPERLEMARLAQNYMEYRNGSDDEKALFCDVLELITGKKYDYTTIRGCCQGDWQEIIYPAEYGRDWLQDFETEYFNTGSEWIAGMTDDDMDTFTVYAHAWNDDGIRAEISDAAGCKPGDVVLYKFDGWSRSPNYKEVV